MDSRSSRRSTRTALAARSRKRCVGGVGHRRVVLMRISRGRAGSRTRSGSGRSIPRRPPPKPCSAYYATRCRSSRSTTRSIGCRTPTRSALAQASARVLSVCDQGAAPDHAHKRLKDCEGELGFLFAALERARAVPRLDPVPAAAVLQGRLASLCAFVEQLPPGCRAAFEFRNDSWLAPEVYAVLEARNLALVHSEDDETLGGDLPWTADWAYLRLRRVVYTPARLDVWLARLRAAPSRSPVFFKHEDQATGPDARGAIPAPRRAEVVTTRRAVESSPLAGQRLGTARSAGALPARSPAC